MISNSENGRRRFDAGGTLLVCLILAVTALVVSYILHIRMAVPALPSVFVIGMALITVGLSVCAGMQWQRYPEAYKKILRNIPIPGVAMLLWSLLRDRDLWLTMMSGLVWIVVILLPFFIGRAFDKLRTRSEASFREPKV